MTKKVSNYGWKKWRKTLSAYKPENWWDSLFCNAPVYSSSRFADGLQATGFIYGFIHNERGAVVQFPQGNMCIRFFIPNEELSKAWVDGTFYIGPQTKVMGVHPNRELREVRERKENWIIFNRKKALLYTWFE